ncbi:MAG: histidine--tRNA ligase [Candidatus Pacebacteria bacterium CG10_big_fil_rev_8_21_14_0_10_36_11]|nr:histidine--tRNA ligase [Candidatus Pacearchaeota archaeon]OIP74050.1 MAG: histidine--tRNA ligase [Candidatus Pacebacteria bacterium CG2_30_36_39]PIR64417.1 MAG: histidine--tRNA ligase [Candidatus Pacebacteria bacterium CG10_big_fil_rev_8_21_14_0_10_36_11]PJC43206.1 MAG: histidine--tRNA ligase [Candidatus Pacebacteria bacterium CG_4_9_14_0_2_um_filter_36_8]
MTQTQPLQTLKGFRDFLPEEKRARDFVVQKIKTVFETFGFQPIETPTLEYASLLLGKYGEEADKLVYTFEDRGDRKIGLRYDQTVPSARVLTQYQDKLPKYFRRYQIQNVFRADKPQKGRFREFTQCDIDIFGSTSPLSDAEIMACTYQAFKAIGFKNIVLRFNDRETLIKTLQPFTNEQVNVFSLIQSIDKLDKIKPEDVVAELVKKGLEKSKAEEALTSIKNAEKSVNLSNIEQNVYSLGIPKEALEFSPILARGLDYYTGMIFEIIIPEYPVGSCGGGGRYDQLIRDLGGPNMPATGVAFGFDRIVEAATALELIPINQGVEVLVANFDKNTLTETLLATQQLRKLGVKTELYPETDKLGKQFKYADQNKMPYVLIVGEEEAKNKTVSIKNMKTGNQTTISLEKIANFRSI